MTEADATTIRPALAVVAVVVLSMVVLPRLHRAIPASLVAVVVATVLVSVTGMMTARIGVLPSQLPTPVWPQADFATVQSLLGRRWRLRRWRPSNRCCPRGSRRRCRRPAATTPIVNWWGRDWPRWPRGCSGMPATGAIARTAVNVRSGARTRVAAITHSILLLGVVYLVSGPVAAIPLAALAAVLMVTAARMISWRVIVRIIRSAAPPLPHSRSPRSSPSAST